MNAQRTVDDLYLEWLYSQVGTIKNRNPSTSYWSLFVLMHSVPFVDFVKNDGNRVADGKDLRDEFVYDTGVDVDILWRDLECSFLEMMIALARRVSFDSYGEPADWFWTLIKNLEFYHYTDKVFNEHVEAEVTEKLQQVVQRTYGRDGVGGLFPLRNAKRDQRRVEIWYQMSAYLMENSNFN